MRFVYALLVLGLCAGTAFADKDKPIDADWHYVVGPDREIIDEVEPNDTCPGQAIVCGDVVDPGEIVAADRDWFTFEATAGDDLILGTQESAGNPTVDTYMELYADDCTTQLAYNDDGGPGLYSLIEFTATYTGTYNVLVRGYSDASTGFYMLFTSCGVQAEGACCFDDGSCVIMTMVDCGGAGGDYYGDGEVCDPNPCPQPPDPPENDTCEGAEEFGYFIERCTAGSLQGDTTPAINDYSPTNGCTGYSAGAQGKDVVYYMDLEAGDIVTLYYDYIDYYDQAFYILTDCGDMESCVVGADDPEEIIGWVVPETGRYYLVLDAYCTDCAGTWTLDYTIECPMPPIGACCFDDGSCVEMLEAECDGYEWYPDTPCDPNPCEPIATEENTWGQIKSSYR